MLTENELKHLLTNLESETIERTRAFDKADKMGQAISAFANDLPNRKKSGYLLLGVENDGNPMPIFDANKLTEFRVTLLPSAKSLNDEINCQSGEIKVYQAIATQPGIKRETLLLVTGIPLRTIDRIVKRLSSQEIQKIEYRGSKRTGGWFVRT